MALHAEPKHLLAKQNISLLILQTLLSAQIIDFSVENILDRWGKAKNFEKINRQKGLHQEKVSPASIN